MIISLIGAMGKNRQIGKNNKLLWRISEDLKNFKRLTLGHHMVMGRKTFESIGKPLPGRTTIILTRNPGYTAEGCKTVSSFNEAKSIAREAGETELFICGGGEIYKDLLGEADKLYLSFVDYGDDADTYFPDYSSIELEEIEERKFPKTEKAPSWVYKVLKKRNK